MQYRPLQVAGSQQQPEPKPPPSRAEVVRQRLRRVNTRFRSLFLVSIGILIALAAMLLYDMIRPLPQQLTQSDIDAAVERALESAVPQPFFATQAYEIIRPSLVRVHTLSMEAGVETEGALGTGVVIEDSGIILTSLHIVQDAVEVSVVFADGSESRASIIAGEPENDLAVLLAEVIPDDLEPATLTSSATLQVGDEVVAVGNPFGISNSLSAGVVSGLGRSFRSQKTSITLTNLIQFDAAVNPGNSGGPLVNRDGEVVGIITALLNPTDEEFFIGIGFAMPIETAAAAAGSPPY
jgi:S1-C subfamily serine protease